MRDGYSLKKSLIVEEAGAKEDRYAASPHHQRDILLPYTSLRPCIVNVVTFSCSSTL